MTFSIVAHCPKTGEMGVALQSHWFNVGRETLWGRSGLGVIATQASVNTVYGEDGLNMFRQGIRPAAALRQLLLKDSYSEKRQVLMLCPDEIALHTGSDCIPCAEHISSVGVACAANLMARPGVPAAMLEVFERLADAPLAERLLAALNRGQAAGGDLRGMQSAAMLVVGGEDTPTWAKGIRINLRIEDHPQPLVELERLLTLRRAYDLLNRSNEAWDGGCEQPARELYAEMRKLSMDNQELVFWSKAAPVQDRACLESKWKELALRLDHKRAGKHSETYIRNVDTPL
jgi:uncharacterized Ntn-hydrolase superfamily protein